MHIVCQVFNENPWHSNGSDQKFYHLKPIYQITILLCPKLILFQTLFGIVLKQVNPCPKTVFFIAFVTQIINVLVIILDYNECPWFLAGLNSKSKAYNCHDRLR